MDFVCELLRREFSLVFGEDEYGVTDILYVAARSRSSEVFKILFDYALLKNIDELVLDEVFEKNMVNIGVHAAARGGNWEILTGYNDFLFFFQILFPIKRSQHELKKEKKKNLHVAPHLSDVCATSAKTKSKLVLRAKTAKDPIQKGLFCILIS